jgi:hypothetical protein
MEKIKDFKDVYEGPKTFEGNKVEFAEVLDKTIVVKDFAELPSKYTNGNFVVIQAELDGKIITFHTGGKVLVKQLNEIKDKLPVRVTITQPDGKKYYIFK